jgi:protein ImuB
MHRERVIVASSQALSEGVKPGMRAGGVSAIAPATKILERNGEKERLALDAIAIALLQYTPEVAAGEDFSLLLDVTASLRLFGGPLALCRRLRASIETLGFTARLGAAPTATGAWLLARWAPGKSQLARRRVLKTRTLARQLDRLPCHLLPAASLHHAWLAGIGADTLGALRRLPRPGLLRRTSAQVLEGLDRAYGQAPELFEWITVPPVFSARMETHDRIEHAQALLFGAQGLMLQLVGWLVSLQQAVSQFVLVLEHERGRAAIPPTEVAVALAEPAWHEGHLIRLLRERLARVELAAPVIAIRLEARQLCPMLPPTLSLFQEQGGSPADFRRLLELLSARLGQENVLAPAAAHDYRPEVCNAWAPAASQQATPADEGAVLERPFWLLPEPIALLMRGDRPFYGSPLKVIRGPERVEAGWWDDRVAARDYYVAQASDASCYWIYLERTGDARWYLHGLYA